MKKAITITAHCRPKLLSEVVKSILNNDTTGFDVIYGAIEPGMTSDNIVQFEALRSRMEVRYILNQTKLGVRKNPFNVLTKAFEEFDFVFYLEDDQLLSPDAFDFIRFYVDNFKDRKDIACAGLYNYNSNPKFPANVEYTKLLCALGLGIFKENWKKIFQPYWFSEDIRLKHNVDPGGIGGWDWSIRAALIEHKMKMVIPRLARSHHIGIEGTHSRKEDYERHFRDVPFSQSRLKGSFIYE